LFYNNPWLEDALLIYKCTAEGGSLTAWKHVWLHILYGKADIILLALNDVF